MASRRDCDGVFRSPLAAAVEVRQSDSKDMVCSTATQRCRPSRRDDSMHLRARRCTNFRRRPASAAGGGIRSPFLRAVRRPVGAEALTEADRCDAAGQRNQGLVVVEVRGALADVLLGPTDVAELLGLPAETAPRPFGATVRQTQQPSHRAAASTLTEMTFRPRPSPAHSS